MSASAPAFAAGALARGAFGVAFAGAAFALAWFIESVPLPTDAARAAAPTRAAAPPVVRELRVESTYAVAAGGWSVAAGGAVVASGHGDDAQWTAAIPAGELIITAAPADESDGRLHGLRARLTGGGDSRELVAWGAGAVTLAIPAAAP